MFSFIFPNLSQRHHSNDCHDAYISIHCFYSRNMIFINIISFFFSNVNFTFQIILGTVISVLMKFEENFDMWVVGDIPHGYANL